MKLYITTLLILINVIFTVQGQEKLKILSYNVLFGLQKDSVTNVQRYTSFVKSLKPDIVSTQEMNGWKQKTLEELAKTYGHTYALQSKEDGFPVALTSNSPLVNFKKVTENMWHSYIYTKIKGVHIFVIHFSPFNYQKRLEEVQNILAQVNELPQDEPILIMGDFNSLYGNDQKNYDNKLVESMQIQESKHDHIRNLNNNKIDYTVLNSLKNAGFSDSQEILNHPFTSTVPTRKDGNGNWKKNSNGIQKRIDFVWCNPTASEMLVHSEIIKNESTDVISDHYPVYVELMLK